MTTRNVFCGKIPNVSFKRAKQGLRCVYLCRSYKLTGLPNDAEEMNGVWKTALKSKSRHESKILKWRREGESARQGIIDRGSV